MRAIYAAAFLLFTCATPGAKPHDMSTAGHEATASEHDRTAAEHAGRYDQGAQLRSPACGASARAGSAAGYGYDACWSSVLNPTEGHLNEAEAHRRHAADHRAASAALREAEARACQGIAPGERDMSPFEHAEDVSSVLPVEGGARIIFRPVEGLTADGLQRHVDCHLARNASLGHDVPEMPACPLVPKGATAKVSAVPGGFEVLVRADDPQVARQILERAQRLRATGGAPASAR